MTDEIKYCTNCGRKMNPYEVTITPMLVNSLIKFRQAVTDKGENCVSITKDMAGKPYELTKYEWSNFSRQRVLALAVKVKGKRGYWLLTKRGANFLNGKEAIPQWVAVYNKRIIERSETLVFVKDVIGTTPYMETFDDIRYQEPLSAEEALQFNEDGQGKLI